MSSIFSPKIPSPPPMVMPKTEDIPSAEDDARKQREEEDARRRNRNRKGRRSTILTSPDYEDEEASTNKPTLLGG